MKKINCRNIRNRLCRIVCRCVATDRSGQGFTRRAGKGPHNCRNRGSISGNAEIFLSDAVPTPIVKAVAESEPLKTEIMAEEKIEPVPPAEPTSHTISKSASASSEPKPGNRAVIDGKPHICFPGFGGIVDESGWSVGTTVGNPGNKLTGNKFGIIGVTVGSDGDINKQVAHNRWRYRCPGYV